jgi:sugar lactone lactonase YvrE
MAAPKPPISDSIPRRARAMTASRRITVAASVLLLAVLSVAAWAQNHAPNPYVAVEGKWGRLADGREWGSTSAIFPARDGSGDIWVGERCGANSCGDRPGVDPILRFTADGELVTSFGAGMIVWPHGMFVDADNNVWITDAVGFGDNPRPDIGHTVLQFSPDGELLMTLGQAGMAGDGPDAFRQPSDVLVASDGSIFVADGHGAGGNNRIVKLAADGTYLMEWGETGGEDGQFRDPHALAMDSAGRLYVGDRGNSRTQIFTQDGEHLATWTQFGRPSGLFITPDDILYSTDSESNARRNPGWKRGIRIGSVTDGFVDFFIPDPEPDQDGSGTSAGEGVAVDATGAVYSAEVGPQQVKKYVRPR